MGRVALSQVKGRAYGRLPCVVVLGACILACADAGPDEPTDPRAASDARAHEVGDAGPHCVDADSLPESAFGGLSPEQAIEAYARRRTAEACTVQLRRGEPLMIEYQIK